MRTYRFFVRMGRSPASGLKTEAKSISQMVHGK